MIHEVVVLSHLSRPPDEQPVVGPHAAVHHADVVSDLLYLVGGVILEQDGLVLLLSCQDHAIDSLTPKLVQNMKLQRKIRAYLDADTWCTTCHSLKSVLNLDLEGKIK